MHDLSQRRPLLRTVLCGEYSSTCRKVRCRIPHGLPRLSRPNASASVMPVASVLQPLPSSSHDCFNPPCEENGTVQAFFSEKHDYVARFSLTLHAGFRRHALFGNTNHTKQTGKMEQDTTNEAKTELIYGLNDRPPLRETLFAALQHLLAIFVAIITPPLIIAGALKLDVETTSFLVSMALFASGVSTFIQCRRIGCIGTGLLCIQGTSFSFIGPIISAGMSGGFQGGDNGLRRRRGGQGRRELRKPQARGAGRLGAGAHHRFQP